MAALLKPLLKQIVVGAPYIFTPLELFSSGEQGAWYEPSDLTTLFQDSAGTTPVTTDGDPVGLMLDKSQGLELGSEEVTNGGFDSAAAWTPALSAVIEDGVLRFPSGADNNSRADQTVALSTDKFYAISIEISGYVSGSLTVEGFGLGATANLVTGLSGNGTHTAVVSGAWVSGIRLRGTGGAPEFDVDNITVKELPGNHATQPSSGLKPIYRTDGTLHWLESDGFDDFMDSPSFPLPQPFTQAAAFLVSNSDGRILGGGPAGGANGQMWRLSSLTLNIFSGASLKLPGLDLGNKAVALAVHNSASSYLRCAQASVDADITGDAGSASSDGVRLFARGGASPSLHGQVDYYGSIVVAADVAERDQVISYLATKSGVTL